MHVTKEAKDTATSEPQTSALCRASLQVAAASASRGHEIPDELSRPAPPTASDASRLFGGAVAVDAPVSGGTPGAEQAGLAGALFSLRWE